jgi:hypothetical protein
MVGIYANGCEPYGLATETVDRRPSQRRPDATELLFPVSLSAVMSSVCVIAVLVTCITVQGGCTDSSALLNQDEVKLIEACEL